MKKKKRQDIPPTLTNDNGSSLGTQGGRDSLGEDVDTLEHALSGVVAKDDILGSVTSSGDRGGLEQPSGSGQSSTRSSEVEHCG